MRTEPPSMRWITAMVTIVAVASTIMAARSANATSNTQGTTIDGSPSAAQRQANDTRVDPQAEQILRRACTTLTSAKAFKFHAEINFENVQLPSRMKLQFAGAADYAVQRPNHLAVDYQSDLGGKRFWYSGKDFTMFDAPSMMYASMIVPRSIDPMLARVANVNNLTISLSDWALSDPCETFSKQILLGSYVGWDDVGGVACYHLAFAESNIDWQIWIQRSGKPLPRKVVINYRSTPGMPQWAAVLSCWKFPSVIPGNRFTPQIPKHAVRIKFIGEQQFQS